MRYSWFQSGEDGQLISSWKKEDEIIFLDEAGFLHCENGPAYVNKSIKVTGTKTSGTRCCAHFIATIISGCIMAVRCAADAPSKESFFAILTPEEKRTAIWNFDGI